MDELESGCRVGDSGRRPDAEGGAWKGMKEHELVMRQSSASLSRSGATRALYTIGDGGGVWYGDRARAGERLQSYVTKMNPSHESQLYPPPLRAKAAKSFSRHSSKPASRQIDLPPTPEPARKNISAPPPRRLQPPRPAAAPLSPPKRT
jgi:hypothetical protein